MNIIKKYYYYIIIGISILTCAHMSDKSNMSTVTLLPKETDVPGWEMIKNPIFLNKKKINKNKSLMSKGILEYAFCKFRSFSNKEQIFTINISKLDNNLNAFGLFSQKKMEDSIEERIDDNLFLTKSGFYALKGEYYISIVSSIEKNKRSDFDKFWEVLDKNIVSRQKKIMFPEFLKFFIDGPDYKDLVYYKNGHEDLPGTQKVFSVKKERTLFFLKEKNDFDAMNLYNGIMKSSNNFIVSQSDDIQLLLNKKNNKYIFISMYKNYIFGVLDAENIQEGKKFIKEIYKNLEKKLKIK